MFGLPRSGRDRRPVEIRPRVYSRTAALTSRADERGRSGRARRAHGEVETAVQPPGHRVLEGGLRADSVRPCARPSARAGQAPSAFTRRCSRCAEAPSSRGLRSAQGCGTACAGRGRHPVSSAPILSMSPLQRAIDGYRRHGQRTDRYPAPRGAVAGAAEVPGRPRPGAGGAGRGALVRRHRARRSRARPGVRCAGRGAGRDLPAARAPAGTAAPAAQRGLHRRCAVLRARRAGDEPAARRARRSDLARRTVRGGVRRHHHRAQHAGIGRGQAAILPVRARLAAVVRRAGHRRAVAGAVHAQRPVRPPADGDRGGRRDAGVQHLGVRAPHPRRLCGADDGRGGGDLAGDGRRLRRAGPRPGRGVDGRLLGLRRQPRSLGRRARGRRAGLCTARRGRAAALPSRLARGSMAGAADARARCRAAPAARRHRAHHRPCGCGRRRARAAPVQGWPTPCCWR